MSDDDFTTDLFGDAEAAKREGMGRVEDNASEQWKALMYSLIIQVARTHQFFTSDHVFDLFYALGNRPETHDYRALGPVMLSAAKHGVCRKADRAPINSRRRSLHASPRSVWRSLIYTGPSS